MKLYSGTRKGLLEYEITENSVKLKGYHFEGVAVSYVYPDPFSKNLFVGLNHGHWGPKIHRRRAGSQEFEELDCPAFPKDSGVSLKNFWSMATDSKGRLYIGVEPAALFTSEDQGDHFELNEAFFNIESRKEWMGGGTDNPCLHSICIHPDNPDQVVVGISVAGVLISKDRAKSFTWANQGMKADFMPDPDPEFGFDPHLVAQSASNPTVFYQQNHCGIYKSENQCETWLDLSENDGLISSFGFAVALDEKDENIAYFAPADSDVNRLPVDRALCVQKTIDGGKSFSRFSMGLPQENCFDLVYRHGLAFQNGILAMATTNGCLYLSRNGAKSFETISSNLSPVYCVALEN